jgi:hypothetical protein
LSISQRNADLPAASRTKLAKLLGMLGSDHAGERDAAALAVRRLIKQSGVTWSQILTSQPVGKKLAELGTWRATCRECLARPGSLRPWEVGFLTALPGFRRLSTKQRYVLKQITDRVLDRVL